MIFKVQSYILNNSIGNKICFDFLTKKKRTEVLFFIMFVCILDKNTVGISNFDFHILFPWAETNICDGVSASD